MTVIRNRHFLHSLELILAERGTNASDWLSEFDRSQNLAEGTSLKALKPDDPILPRNMRVLAHALGISDEYLSGRIRSDNDMLDE